MKFKCPVQIMLHKTYYSLSENKPSPTEKFFGE